MLVGCVSTPPSTIRLVGAWESPQYGSEVATYTWELWMNELPYETGETTQKSMQIEIDNSSAGSSFKLRVAGIGVTGRQGGWSEFSKEYVPLKTKGK